MLIVIFIIGAILFFLGVIIWKYNLTKIIAGYDEEKTKDKQGLTKWVGLNLIIMGVLSILISILGKWFINNISYFKSGTPWLLFIFFIVIIIFSLWTVLGCKKYEK
ncbi:DUF3784 domain-containing protein [Halocella sp. SP3-1]|uniref:DUF3784 domain-containing protein n=1 Tax=Halocella sp. SP3-1 TaxID=2382161 RepID=UPI000F7537C8|nr:DUF3784 domain-containing protein [Halocella sp. SP3-1]AZO95314.1 DUF3784 domain-containing protein [Halocella sp. SP3-1]MTI61066.1 DUF3784 domain-containing protein [Bacillota bacterium]